MSTERYDLGSGRSSARPLFVDLETDSGCPLTSRRYSDLRVQLSRESRDVDKSLWISTRRTIRRRCGPGARGPRDGEPLIGGTGRRSERPESKGIGAAE